MRLSYFHLAAIIGQVILPAWMVNAVQVGGKIGAGNAPAYALDARAAPPDHIVVVVEENHGYSQIIGNPDAAYINSLAAAGTLFINYHAVSHPSEPNYFALFTGSTQGIRDDGTYFFANTPTLASELRQAGYSFVGYAEPPIERDHAPWLSFGDFGKASVRPSANFQPISPSCQPCLSLVPTC